MGAPARFRISISPSGLRHLVQRPWLGLGFASRPTARADGQTETLAMRRVADPCATHSRYPVRLRFLNLTAALQKGTNRQTDQVGAPLIHQEMLYLLATSATPSLSGSRDLLRGRPFCRFPTVIAGRAISPIFVALSLLPPRPGKR